MIRLLGTFLIIAGLFSCATPPEEPPPPPPPKPLSIDWTANPWVWEREDDSQGQLRSLPRYQGFRLHQDGRLFFINDYKRTGGSWTAQGNHLTFTLKSGGQENYLVFPEKEGVRLKPTDSEEEGKFYQPALPWIDLEEDHWIPVWLQGEEVVSQVSSQKVYLLFLPGQGGMGITGYGGVNRFHAGVDYDDETIALGNISRSRRQGMGIEYEDLYLKHLQAADFFIQVRSELYLYTDTSPLVTFRIMMFE